MAKGMHKGDLSRQKLVDMKQQGAPVGAIVAGYTGDNRASYDSMGTHGNVYPDGYSGGHSRGESYPHSMETYGTANGSLSQPPFAGNDRGANRYATAGYV